MITSNKIIKAIEFCRYYHRNQVRTFNTIFPYHFHPMGAMAIVASFKKSKHLEELMISAILHDIVEDTDVSVDMVRKEFGDMVANIVEELTSDKKEIEKSNKADYLSNKMINMSSYALVVKLADRLNNIMDININNKPFFEKYTYETKIILENLTKKRKNLSSTHKELILLLSQKIFELENEIIAGSKNTFSMI